MKSYRGIVWKEIKVQKLTSALIIIAIVLSTLMTTVIGQSIGILDAMRVQQAIALNGDRYATFHQLDGATDKKLEKDRALSYAGKFITLGSSKIGDSGLSLFLREYEGDALTAYANQYQVKEGRLPERENEVALPENIVRLLGQDVAIGDEINLPMEVSLLKDTEEPYKYSKAFLLTGIVGSNYISYVSGTVDGIVGKGTAENTLPEKYRVYSVDVRTKGKSNFQDVVYGLEDRYKIPDAQVQYNDTLLSAMGIKYDSSPEGTLGSGFSYMALAGIVIGGLVLLAAGLVVFNILKISVNKKIKQYGTLRAIGANAGKLYALVSLQLAMLCGIGIPIGAFAGALSAKGITKAVTRFFTPEMFMADSQKQLADLVDANSKGNPWFLLLSIVVTLVFTVAAAFPAARMASKVSPTLAMSGSPVKIKRRNRKSKRIHSFEAFYARMNMGRNKGRTLLTILSLVMSITVFIALQGFAGLLDASSSIQKMHLGDYSLTNEQEGFPPDVVDGLTSMAGIDKVLTLKYKLFEPDANNIPQGISTDIRLQPGETLQICGLDESLIRQGTPKLSDFILNKLKRGEGCIVKNPVLFGTAEETSGQTSYNIGDKVSMNNTELEVLAVSDEAVTLDNEGFTNGLQIIVYDSVYNGLTGEENYTELYPLLAGYADKGVVEASIKKICSESPGSRWLSYEETDKQLEESYAQIKLLAWGLIIFIGLIGILNIINTVYTNIHTRLGEIGIQRAIGMDMAGFYRTFLWEGVYYGIAAAIVGSIFGYTCTLFVEAAANDTFQIVSFPIIPALEASAIFIGACLIATILPLSRVAKMDIVECIDIVE